jgi:hypothetical protein
MIILMFGGQAMYFPQQFNIITTPLRCCKDGTTDAQKADIYGNKDIKSGDPSNRMRKDTLCFHTFMLMNLINMINCRVVKENESNVFKTLLNNK